MKIRNLLTVLTLFVVGCGENSAPPVDPSNAAEPESPAEPEASEPDAPEPDAPEPEAAEPEAAEPEAPSDSDGDGVVDAADNCVATANPDQTDADADGIGDRCDPCVAQDEACDGADNDCDGNTDEGVTNACGVCGPVPDEACDGADNDCDGNTDEGVTNACGACGPVPNEACDGADNDCDGSTDEGVVNACGACGPVPREVCDGADNDCDGLTDEGFDINAACSVGRGSCAAGGQTVCAPGGDGVICDAGPGDPIPEACDGADNDCDGSTDEGVTNACGACGPVPDEACDGEDNDCDGQTDEGVTNACGACGAVPDEVCDDVDNDCDGNTDEGVTNACGACGAVPDEVCDDVDNDCDGNTDEGVTNACGACGPVPLERCDDRDNDCDGEVDEGYQTGGLCTTGRGECRAIGFRVCAPQGDAVTCSARAGQPEAEICDGRDNDCDGESDEDARDVNACGVCGPVPVESCNGEDDDCDGRVDEDFDLGAACESGMGDFCRQPGQIECAHDGTAVCDVPLADLRACHSELTGKLAVGSGYTCVVLFGRVKCFGMAPAGEWSPQGHRPDTMGANLSYFDMGMQIEQIAARAGTMCARDDEGRVKCIGTNSFGELGLGRWEHDFRDWAVADRPFIDLHMRVNDIVPNVQSVCVRGSQGVKCWGNNAGGQFGLGHPDLIGDQPNDMGANLPYVRLGFGRAPWSLSLAVSSQCVVGRGQIGGEVKCWGQDYDGSLGQPGVEQIGESLDEMGNNLPSVDLGMRVAQVASAGASHCALGDSGAVKCWGRSLFPGALDGVAALDEPLDVGIRVVAISAGLRQVCAIGTEGELVCWGQDHLTQERHGPRRINLGMPVVDVAVGLTHACAMGGRGDVKCWGQNAEGQLGQGDVRDRGASRVLQPIDLF